MERIGVEIGKVEDCYLGESDLEKNDMEQNDQFEG